MVMVLTGLQVRSLTELFYFCSYSEFTFCRSNIGLNNIYLNTAKSDEIVHPMNLRSQCHKTVSRNCKKSVTLLQTHEENILPYTVKTDSTRAVPTFPRNFRFFAIRKSLKMDEWNFSSILGMCMSKIVYTNS